MPGLTLAWASAIRLRLRTSLVFLVGLSLIPVMIFGGFVVRELWIQQVNDVGETLRQTNAALAIAVERELASTITTLQAIAELPALKTGALPDIRDEHQRLLLTHPAWSAIILLRADGAQLSDTRVPFGTPLPSFADRRHIAQVAASLKPSVSDVFVDGSRAHVVEVAVPVFRDGRLRYILAAPLGLDRLRELFLTADVVGVGVAAILDSQLRFVARARDSERQVGEMPTPEFTSLLRRPPRDSGDSKRSRVTTCTRPGCQRRTGGA